MAKGYSTDLRVRAFVLHEEGESAREAARVLKVGASTTIRWSSGLRRRVVSKPSPAWGTAARRSRRTSNGCSSLSPLTLEEIWARLKREEKLEVAASSIWRFCDRHEITYEKSLHAAEQDRPDVAAARTELKAEQPKLKAPRLVFIDETAVTTKMVRHYGRAPLGERLVAKKVKVAIARKLNKRMLDEESEVKMSPARRLTSTRS